MCPHFKHQSRHNLIALILILFATLPTLAQKPEMVIQTGHLNSVRAITISPDSSLLASAGADNTIILWDTKEGTQLYSFNEHSEWVLSLAFSPDGKLLASGSADGTVKLWNVAEQRKVYEIPLHPYSVSCVAFSPDGNTLAISSADKVIKLWDMTTRKMKPDLQGHTDSVIQVAFSPDRKHMASTSWDKTVILWDLTTGQFRRSKVFSTDITSIAYSPDGNFLSMATFTDGIVVMDLRLNDPKIIIQPLGFPSHQGHLDLRHWRRLFLRENLLTAGTVTFRSNKELAFVDSYKLRLWDIETNKEVLSHEISSGAGSFAVTTNKDGQLLAFADGRDIKILDLMTQQTKVLKGGFSNVEAVALSADGRTLVWSLGDVMGSWGRDIELQQVIPDEQYQLMGKLLNAESVYISQNKLMASILKDDTGAGSEIQLLDHALNRVSLIKAKVTSIAVNPQGTILASGEAKGTITLWSGPSLKPIKTLQPGKSVWAMAFSPDGKLLAGGIDNGTIRLWDTQTWETRTIEGISTGRGIIFSPNHKLIAIIGHGFVTVCVVDTGQTLFSSKLDTTPEDWAAKPSSQRAIFPQNTVTIFSNIAGFSTASGPMAFDPDSRFIAYEEFNRVTAEHVIKVWDIAARKLKYTLSGHVDSIRSMTFTLNGKVLISGSWDTTVKFWGMETGQELATLISLDKESWVIITPDGRFDTNKKIEDITLLHGTISNDALNPLPLDIFTPDYWTPNLLSRLLKGEKLPDPPSLADLNFARPKIEKITVIPRPKTPERVDVKVEVSSTPGQCLKDDKQVPCESGVYDLRLFRDGQIVGQSPSLTEAVPIINFRGPNRQESLRKWRELSAVKTKDGRPVQAATGVHEVTFTNIPLPQRPEVSQVEFTAYAFNDDHKKGATSTPVVYQLPPQRRPVKRRAYIITVGVDATSDPRLRLLFAPHGARDIEQLLTEKFKSQYEVVPISLVSEYKENSTELKQFMATKTNIRAVLGILSGQDKRTIEASSLPNQALLQEATPDDLVILYVASHGYAEPAGHFYVIPSDIGTRAVSDEVIDGCLKPSRRQQDNVCREARKYLSKSVSSDDLTQWLRAIDAGQMTLILDSCHSAAISGPDFKPGPMGDPGFGQLSYDKGMLVLVATQAENVASGSLKLDDRSLLTHALTHQQIAGSSFDLKQWLRQAEIQVPVLYRQYFNTEQPQPGAQNQQQQEPTLFDFTKNRR